MAYSKLLGDFLSGSSQLVAYKVYNGFCTDNLYKKQVPTIREATSACYLLHEIPCSESTVGCYSVCVLVTAMLWC